MSERKKLLCAPLILAPTAVAIGVNATIFFVINDVTAVKLGEAEKIKLGEFPSLKEVMDQAIAAGVKLLICEQSCNLLGIPRGALVKASKVVGAATLNDLVLEADGVMYF